MLLLLVVWVICLFCIALKYLYKPDESVGLSMAYVLTLTIIHFFGGLIYLVPTHYVYIDPVTLDGFKLSVYGVIAFTLGNLVLAPLMYSTLGGFEKRVVSIEPSVRLPIIYSAMGIGFYVVVVPAVNHIPSVSALAVSGVFLALAGIALGTWRAWWLNRHSEFLFWLLLAATIPFVTMLGLGFLGYGATALMMILLFVFQFYRPRKRGVMIGVLILYVGISFFVNYARERSDLRDSVWGGQDLASRVSSIAPIFYKFEFFDVSNSEHVERINDRLNQNFLVGRSIRYIDSGYQSFSYGETIKDAMYAMIPRLLWPDKPLYAGSGTIVTDYTGLVFAQGTSVGVGHVMEFYINFGNWGVIIGFMCIGVVVSLFDRMASRKLWSGDWEGFVFWFLPGLGLLQTGGNMAELTSTVLASFLIVALINRYVLPYWVPASYSSPAD